MFITALFLGLALGGIPYFTETIPLICLMIAMSLSTTRVRFREAFDLKRNFNAILTIIFLNFIVLTGLILVLGALFEFSFYIWAGIVVMAAVPPAVAVIPFVDILKGDNDIAVGATAAVYIASLLITPAIILIFLGADTDIGELVKTLILMIVIPLVISRILRKYRTDEKMGIYKPITVNLAFALLVFTVVGVNRSVFFEDPHLVLSLVVISIIRTAVIGAFIFNFSRRLGTARIRNVTYTLFASYKNLGLAIVIAFTLFGSVATIPATICIPFEIIAFIYFKKMM